MTTTAHSSTTPLAADLRRSGFVGRVVMPGDPDYHRSRIPWNAAIDRYPAAVAYASDADDVAAAIRTARACELPFTIRAGSHSVSGRSLRDDALCIDIRGLNGVEADPRTRRVRVGGGALLGELDAATQQHGLAVPGGQISHTGVGGLTLGGGVGWLMRAYGLTIDSLVGADVVLADGSPAQASADDNPELFWALRGGGGDFAAVTTFEFVAHPVGPIVLGGLLAYPWEQAADVFATARAIMRDAPPELTIFVVLATVPPAPPFPTELFGQRVVGVAACWCGDPEEGVAVLSPLRSQLAPALDLIGPMPYVALQSMLDDTAPPGWRYYDRQHYLDEIGDPVVEALLDGFTEAPTPQCHVMTAWLGGAVDGVAPGETAFGHRGARALTWLIGCTPDGPLDPVTSWVRDLWLATKPFATDGVYVNALDAGRSVKDAYAPSVWDRLSAIKRRYDPSGAFTGNGITG